MKDLKPGATRALFLSTTAFAVSFAVWGLVAALAPTFAQAYGLSAKSKSLMIAIPVLLGSLGRLPAGMLADRFGGRKVFTLLLLLSAVPAIGIGLSTSYAQLLWLGVFIGMAGTSFAIGVSFTSRWFTKDQQGTALGIFGMGNIGQSVAVFGAPVLALWLSSWRPVFYIFAGISLVWGLVFYLFAHDAVSSVKPKTLSESLGVLRRSPLAWVLSLFYFLTFGGFVAFSIYLPTLLKDLFQLSPADAGARTAGFVLLATFMRPVGGILADRMGGGRVLVGVVSLGLPIGSAKTVQEGKVCCISAWVDSFDHVARNVKLRICAKLSGRIVLTSKDRNRLVPTENIPKQRRIG